MSRTGACGVQTPPLGPPHADQPWIPILVPRLGPKRRAMNPLRKCRRRRRCSETVFIGSFEIRVMTTVQRTQPLHGPPFPFPAWRRRKKQLHVGHRETLGFTVTRNKNGNKLSDTGEGVRGSRVPQISA